MTAPRVTNNPKSSRTVGELFIEPLLPLYQEDEHPPAIVALYWRHIKETKLKGIGMRYSKRKAGFYEQRFPRLFSGGPILMSTAHKDEMIGRIYRAKTANRQRLAFVNSELNGIVALFKKASSQLECLLANERSEINSVLSQLNIDRTLQLVAEREKLQRDIHSANEELKRLGVPL